MGVQNARILPGFLNGDDFQQFNIVLPLVAEIEQITESVSNFKRDLFQFGFRRIQLVVIQFAIRRGYLCPADIETVKVFFRPVERFENNLVQIFKGLIGTNQNVTVNFVVVGQRDAEYIGFFQRFCFRVFLRSG